MNQICVRRGVLKVDFTLRHLFNHVGLKGGDFMKTDTIAAIATGASSGGISIIRISGDEAFNVIDKIYKSKKKK